MSIDNIGTSAEMMREILNLTPRQQQELFQVSCSYLGPEERVDGPLKVEYWMAGQRLGWARLEINRRDENGRIFWDQFYPLCDAPKAQCNGLGTLAHTATLVALITQSPEISRSYRVQHNPHNITPPRRRQLSAMRLRFDEELGHYLAKSIAYANRIKGFHFTNPFSP